MISIPHLQKPCMYGITLLLLLAGACTSNTQSSHKDKHGSSQGQKTSKGEPQKRYTPDSKAYDPEKEQQDKEKKKKRLLEHLKDHSSALEHIKKEVKATQKEAKKADKLADKVKKLREELVQKKMNEEGLSREDAMKRLNISAEDLNPQQTPEENKRKTEREKENKEAEEHIKKLEQIILETIRELLQLASKEELRKAGVTEKALKQAAGEQ